jgi:benzoate-CoA ligase family protein
MALETGGEASMRDNTVVVDHGAEPPALEFAPVFNVAVPFIDRHLEEGRGGRPAIRTVSESVTYTELAERVNRCGNVFGSLRLEAGARVLMMVKDCPEFIYLFFGAIKSGVIPVPVNTMLREDDYRFLIDDCRCAVLIYSPEFTEIMAVALDRAAHKPAHILDTDRLPELMAAQPNSLAAAQAAPTDDCFWLYSSGSTGNPKGVVHGHRAMVCTGQRVAVETHGLGADDQFFSASKLFHSYGFGNALTFPLWVGGTAMLSDRRVSPAMIFELIAELRPTAFYGVPTLYAQQLQAMESATPDLSSLRRCLSAGEALPGDVFRRWKEATGLDILDGLGSTEMLHMFVSNSWTDIKPGSSGRVIPGYEVKIVDDDRNPVAAGDIGVLLAKGESSASRYWNNPEKTAMTMPGEWLDTGDMYYQDADGCYVYCGRGDDMMKVGGLWCSPFEIEARLIEHPKVLEAAVVGRADEDGLIKPEAHVVLNDAADAGHDLAAVLTQHCRDALDHYKYPRWFHFVDDLPKTATGKIQRFRLRG